MAFFSTEYSIHELTHFYLLQRVCQIYT